MYDYQFRILVLSVVSDHLSSLHECFWVYTAVPWGFFRGICPQFSAGVSSLKGKVFRWPWVMKLLRKRFRIERLTLGLMQTQWCERGHLEVGQGRGVLTVWLQGPLKPLWNNSMVSSVFFSEPWNCLITLEDCAV